MSLIVYIAHTGLRLEVDPSPYSSLDALKAWIAKQTSILENHQIILTARGKLVRNINTLSEDEIFVYDRVLFTIQEGQPRAGSPEIPVPELFHPEDPPASILEQSNLQSWQTLFKERQRWAVQLSQRTDNLLDGIHLYDSQAAAIQRATAIASERLKQNTGGLQDKYVKAKTWVEETLYEPKVVSGDFRDTFRRLGKIEANPEVLGFFRSPKNQGSLPRTVKHTLDQLVDYEAAVEAVARSGDAIKWLEKQTFDLGAAYEDLQQSCDALAEDSQNDFAALAGASLQHSADSLANEMQAIFSKINTDCETALSSIDNDRTISSLSRVASHHTHNLLPSMMETARDISALLQRTIHRRNDSQTLALQTIQKISLLEVRFADIQSGISGLGIEEEEDRAAFETLGFVAGLPSMYASVLCEIVRRCEWSKKMMTDSSTLAEEMATYKDDEERRRVKWLKSVQGVLRPDVLVSKALNVDINVKDVDTSWPKLSRKAIDDYITMLRSVGGFRTILNDIVEQVNSLDAPSKQQVRRANAFRNGSIHDATYGRQSLLLRGDDELINALQADKTRLEDRLKGSESRIRKLEDLLHRQSQTSRIPGSSPRNSLDRPPSSPVLNHPGLPSPKGGPDAFSRHSSASSRRVSVNYGPEENALAQRIVLLEAELASERTRAAQNNDHLKTQEDLKLQVQEAASMKKDLMENFNAQQVEFDGERRLFTDQNRKLKMRLEEMEEEVDRLLGSNDNAKLGLDERIHAHEKEVESVRQEASEELNRLQGQVDYVQKECNTQRELAYDLERKIKVQDKEKKAREQELASLRTELRLRDEQHNDHRDSLKAICSQLSEDASIPEGFSALLNEAESLSRKVSNHLLDIKVALDSARTENASCKARLSDYEQEIALLRKQHERDIDNRDTIQEQLQGKKAQYLTLEAELVNEREELARLRNKLSAGESGSEALRSRIADEEEKAASLRVEMASLKTHTDQLEASLVSKSEELEKLRGMKQDSEHVLFERAQRAEQVSVLLFSQTDRLTHLLEHIGYSVLRQDDSMIIQRIPRASSGGVPSSDQSQSLNKSLSGPVPKTTSAAPDYIHWSLATVEDQEVAQFDMFVEESQAFDMDAFSEAIVKRIKDTEHIARKWQREAKSYREKFHRAHFEAQNKIAFRSFREGDLALFLPTRNTAPNQRSWAAFNVGAPHYFLREQDSHRLSSRDWLLARISKVEERVVDLSKSETSLRPPPSNASLTTEDDNPFGLSDGLRWYYLDASEEKLGAPTTPGLGKTTVASAHVDAAGSIQRKKDPGDDGAAVTRTLAKSLDSRRSSGNSRKSLAGGTASPVTATVAHGDSAGAPGAPVIANSSLRAAESASDSLAATAGRIKGVPSKASALDEVRGDQLFGP